MGVAKPAPLAGRRVVVTRAREQSADLVRALEALGAEVLLLPAVAFCEPEDCKPLDQAIQSLAGFDWILLTSQNAARFLTARCRALGVALPFGAKMNDTAVGRGQAARPAVAAVGPVTAEAAKEEGLAVDYVATQFRGAALGQELGPRLAGKRILLPRSDRAGAELPSTLRSQGAEVVDVVAYRTVAAEPSDTGAAEAIRRGEVDVITFMSPSAFQHLAGEIGLETLQSGHSKVALAAIGPVTAAAIREVGLPVEMEASEATAASLVAAIRDYFALRASSGVKSR